MAIGFGWLLQKKMRILGWILMASAVAGQGPQSNRPALADERLDYVLVLMIRPDHMEPRTMTVRKGKTRIQVDNLSGSKTLSLRRNWVTGSNCWPLPGKREVLWRHGCIPQ